MAEGRRHLRNARHPLHVEVELEPDGDVQGDTSLLQGERKTILPSAIRNISHEAEGREQKQEILHINVNIRIIAKPEPSKLVHVYQHPLKV